MKIGDTVRIKSGLIGGGMTGVILAISPWASDSYWPDLRENYYWLLMEDGVKNHFHWSKLETLDGGELDE